MLGAWNFRTDLSTPIFAGLDALVAVEQRAVAATILDPTGNGTGGLSSSYFH
jgi:hypothetical protein